MAYTVLHLMNDVLDCINTLQQVYERQVHITRRVELTLGLMFPSPWAINLTREYLASIDPSQQLSTGAIYQLVAVLKEIEFYTRQYGGLALFVVLPDSNHYREFLEELDGQSKIRRKFLDYHCASVDNMIIGQTNRISTPDFLEPFKKKVTGSGQDLALTIVPAHLQGEYIVFVQRIMQEAAVGDTPPDFCHNLSQYTDFDILNLVVFYNEAFGIGPADPLPTRIQKLRRFLTSA